MDELNAILRQIIENIADDTVRLVYADRLDELPTQRVVCRQCGLPLADGSLVIKIGGCDHCDHTGEVLDTLPQTRAELIRTQIELAKPQKITITPASAMYLAIDKEYLGYLSRVYGAVESMSRGRNFAHGLPETLCGAELFVADDGVGLRSLRPFMHVKDLLDSDEARNGLIHRETKLLEALAEIGLLTGRENYTRGFVSSWTGTAENWLKIHRAIFWHPDQKELVDCDRCGGQGRVFGSGRRPIGTVCKKCDGAGEILQQRPCPPSAQPLREVKLTTEMDLAGLFDDDGLDTFDLGAGVTPEQWRKKWSEAWPGLRISSSRVSPYRNVRVDFGDGDVREMKTNLPVRAGQPVVYCHGVVTPVSGDPAVSRAMGIMAGVALTGTDS